MPNSKIDKTTHNLLGVIIVRIQSNNRRVCRHHMTSINSLMYITATIGMHFKEKSFDIFIYWNIFRVEITSKYSADRIGTNLIHCTTFNIHTFIRSLVHAATQNFEHTFWWHGSHGPLLNFPKQQGPSLLTWVNFNPSMDKQLHAQ